MTNVNNNNGEQKKGALPTPPKMIRKERKFFVATKSGYSCTVVFDITAEKGNKQTILQTKPASSTLIADLLAINSIITNSLEYNIELGRFECIYINKSTLDFINNETYLTWLKDKKTGSRDLTEEEIKAVEKFTKIYLPNKDRFKLVNRYNCYIAKEVKTSEKLYNKVPVIQKLNDINMTFAWNSWEKLYSSLVEENNTSMYEDILKELTVG